MAKHWQCAKLAVAKWCLVKLQEDRTVVLDPELNVTVGTQARPIIDLLLNALFTVDKPTRRDDVVLWIGMKGHADGWLDHTCSMQRLGTGAESDTCSMQHSGTGVECAIETSAAQKTEMGERLAADGKGAVPSAVHCKMSMSSFGEGLR